MQVSVVIPTYCRPRLLRRCLESLAAGQLQPAEIVVCDQSRDDATRVSIEALRAGLAPLVYLRLPRPNAAAARNAGLFAARSDLVAYLDDDCIAERQWLAALVNEYSGLSRTEPVVAVTGRVLPLFAGRRGVAVSSRTATKRRVFRAWRGELDRGEWAPWDIGTGGNLLASQAILAQIEGFDSHLGPGTSARAAEDIDLVYRLARVGTVGYQPNAVVYHPVNSRRQRLISRYSYGLGMGAMLAKHVAAGDPAARRLLGLYLRHQSANGFRRGVWGPPETLLVLAGVLAGLRIGRDTVRGRTTTRSDDANRAQSEGRSA